MKKNLIVFLLFLILTIIITFPLVLEINSYIPGFYSTDEPFGTLWNLWRVKYSWNNHLSLRYTPLIAYPFGLDMFRSGYIPYLDVMLMYFLTIITMPVVTYNLLLLLNLFLSGILTYFLAFYLFKNRLAAIFSGIIFAFCPYQFIRLWQHPGLTYNQWLPLSLLSLILLKENFSKAIALLFIFSLLLLYSFDQHIMLFGSFIIVLFLVYLLICHRKKSLFKQDLIFYKRTVALWGLVLVILLLQYFPIIKNTFKFSSSTPASAFNPYHRPFEDLFAQSARPLSYLLPALVHPVFGKFTEQFIGSQLYGISLTEHTLYLGWVPLVLAFAAIRRWRRNKKLRITNYELRVTDNEDFYIGFFVFLALIAWFFSQPPWWKIGPFKIFMPSFFIYKVLPMLRAYCRFGIVVMLAVSVLAGYGLKFILAKLRTTASRIMITGLFCALVLFEFWNYPPFKVIDVSERPAVYYWLKGQPKDFVIAEYPIDADSPNEMYKFYQTFHEKKIINGTIPGTKANKIAKTITKLSSLDTAVVLKGMGVRYTLVHRDEYLKTELIEEIEEVKKIPHNPALKLIRSFPTQQCPEKDIICTGQTGPIDIYEVIAFSDKTRN